jgi:hypothetical protein
MEGTGMMYSFAFVLLTALMLGNSFAGEAAAVDSAIRPVEVHVQIVLSRVERNGLAVCEPGFKMTVDGTEFVVPVADAKTRDTQKPYAAHVRYDANGKPADIVRLEYEGKIVYTAKSEPPKAEK